MVQVLTVFIPQLSDRIIECMVWLEVHEDKRCGEAQNGQASNSLQMNFTNGVQSWTVSWSATPVVISNTSFLYHNFAETVDSCKH